MKVRCSTKIQASPTWVRSLAMLSDHLLNEQRLYFKPFTSSARTYPRRPRTTPALTGTKPGPDRVRTTLPEAERRNTPPTFRQLCGHNTSFSQRPHLGQPVTFVASMAEDLPQGSGNRCRFSRSCQ